MRALGAIAAGILALWVLGVQLWRYPGEWALLQAQVRLDGALQGQVPADRLARVVEEARVAADAAATRLPRDARVVLVQALAALIQQRGSDAVALLETALLDGPRPELALNLGRARALLGDEAGAWRAFRAAAWASPIIARTLPAAARQRLEAELQGLESALRAGTLEAVPTP